MKNNNQSEDDISAGVYLKTNVSIKDGSGWVDAFTFCGKYGLSIHVITAWNPGETRFDEDTNEARNQELLDQLRELDCTVFESVGTDPDSEYFEKSWAIVGLTRETAIDIGRQFGQLAVFHIDESRQTVVNCFDEYTYTRANHSTVIKKEIIE
jgi:hypothetical protein